MNITTIFNLGDIVYLKRDAIEGKLIPLIVEKINISVETTTLTVVSYQISSTEKFHNSIYYETELDLYENAKILAENALDEDISELEKRKQEL